MTLYGLPSLHPYIATTKTSLLSPYLTHISLTATSEQLKKINCDLGNCDLNTQIHPRCNPSSYYLASSQCHQQEAFPCLFPCSLYILVRVVKFPTCRSISFTFNNIISPFYSISFTSNNIISPFYVTMEVVPETGVCVWGWNGL